MHTVIAKSYYPAQGVPIPKGAWMHAVLAKSSARGQKRRLSQSPGKVLATHEDACRHVALVKQSHSRRCMQASNPVRGIATPNGAWIHAVLAKSSPHTRVPTDMQKRCAKAMDVDFLGGPVGGRNNCCTTCTLTMKPSHRSPPVRLATSTPPFPPFPPMSMLDLDGASKRSTSKWCNFDSSRKGGVIENTLAQRTVHRKAHQH